MGTLEIVNNYRKFGRIVRYQTALVLLKEIESTDDKRLQGALISRILEDVIAATEDLAMWLIAISSRNNDSETYPDLWERLTNVNIPADFETKDPLTNDVLKDIQETKSGDELLRKLNLTNSEEFIRFLNSEREEFSSAINKIKEAVDSSLHNRSVNTGALVRFQVRMKHGMHLLFDDDKKVIWTSEVRNKKKKRGNKREMEIEINISRAKKMVGTLLAIAQAIDGLIILTIKDFQFALITGEAQYNQQDRQAFLEKIEVILN